MTRNTLEPGLSALRDFRRTWPQLLLVSVATRVAVTVVFIPAIALLLRLFLSAEGRQALSDQEIVFFFLSPVGLVALVIVGGTAIGVAFLEAAGLMTIGFGAAEDRRITWFGALRYVVRELRRILRLGRRLLIRALFVIVPPLVLLGGVYWLLLRQHDLNFYLTNRPPEFRWALALAGVVLAGGSAVLIWKILSWLLSLPAVLFENLAPREAIRDSIADSRGHRWTLFWWLLVWLLLGFLASAVITWLIGFIGRVAVPEGSQSLALVALIMGAVGVLGLVANAVLSFLSSALFALLVVRLYRIISGPGRLARDIAEVGSLGEHPSVWIPRKGILWWGAAALAASTIAAIVAVRSLELEDHTLIIAHRGAMTHAPENTMAAVNRAIADGSDYIEIDVQETADGEVVVFHDSDFMKTAGIPLHIWNARRADIDGIDIGSWFDARYSSERVPTLEEVLLAAKGRARVNIELKYYGFDNDLEQRVVDVVEGLDMADQVVVMSLKYDKVQKIRALRPDWRYGLLTTVNLGDPTTFDVDFLAVNAAAANAVFIRRAQRRGRDVYVWTVNDPYLMSAMMGRGVDGIITDDPGLARQILQIRSQLDPVQRILVDLGSEIGAFSMPKLVGDGDDA